jgi:3-oxoacyl-[acyl-carrier protein] reductase
VNLGLHNRVVVVTGAVKGIGRATAEAFAQEGSRVIVADIDRLGAEEAAREISKKWKTESLAVGMDVTDKVTSLDLMKEVVAAYGGVDVVVNNAGLVHAHPVEEMSAGHFVRQLDVNLTGALFVCQAAFPYMKEVGGGVIVNVSSIGGKRPSKGSCGYGPSKAALSMLTMVMALEWAQYGIRVNAVAPYAIETDFMKPFFAVNKQEFINKIPLGRVGNPDDVAKAILFLASDMAPFITGEVLAVNGGAFMAM